MRRFDWPRRWPRLLRLWQEYDGFAVTVYTETREWNWDGPPMWVWRPLCWAFGHEPYDEGFPKDNYCIVCQKVLGSPHLYHQGAIK